MHDESKNSAVLESGHRLPRPSTRKQLMLAAFLIASASVSADERAIDSGSVALGSDLAAFQENPRFACRHVGKPVADHICNLALGQTANLGTVPVTQMLLYFYGGKLHTIAIFFEELHFAEISAALAKKYGEGKTRTQKLKDSKGDTLDNVIRWWREGETTLEVRRYAGRPTRSKLTHHTDYAIEEFKRRAAARSKPPDQR